MYKKILVPLDGSELAEVVFPYAKELAGRLDLDLIFLHVYGPDESEFAPMHRDYIQHACETVGRELEEVQEKTGGQPGSTEVEARCELAEGHPAENILRYADENEIDLILMATHGRSGFSRWAVGSVADKVVRASKVPVWLVRAGIPEEIVYDKWPTRTMLVPLDGSKLAELVLPHVEALAKQRGAELMDIVLFTVCEGPTVVPAGQARLMYYDTRVSVDQDEHLKQKMAQRNREAEDYLAGVEKRLKDAGLKARSEVLWGNPADEIVAYANRNPFNLIVMTTHALSGLSRWAMGSVADRVVRGVSRPVFLVRPR